MEDSSQHKLKIFMGPTDTISNNIKGDSFKKLLDLGKLGQECMFTLDEHKRLLAILIVQGVRVAITIDKNRH